MKKETTAAVIYTSDGLLTTNKVIELEYTIEKVILYLAEQGFTDFLIPFTHLNYFFSCFIFAFKKAKKQRPDISLVYMMPCHKDIYHIFIQKYCCQYADKMMYPKLPEQGKQGVLIDELIELSSILITYDFNSLYKYEFEELIEGNNIYPIILV